MAFPHEKKVRCFEVVNHPMYGKSLVTGSDDGLIRQWNIQVYTTHLAAGTLNISHSDWEGATRI